MQRALLEAEILTSPCPMYLLNSAQFWSLAICPQVCGHLPSGLEMFLCVTGTSKEHLVHGALIEAEILTSTLPHVFAQLGLALVTGTLAAGVSTPPTWSKMFLCVSGTSKKIGAWDPNRSWDIDLPTPPCICSTWPGLWVQVLCPLVCQHLPSGLKCTYVSQQHPENVWCIGL